MSEFSSDFVSSTVVVVPSDKDSESCRRGSLILDKEEEEITAIAVQSKFSRIGVETGRFEEGFKEYFCLNSVIM